MTLTTAQKIARNLLQTLREKEARGEPFTKEEKSMLRLFRQHVDEVQRMELQEPMDVKSSENPGE